MKKEDLLEQEEYDRMIDNDYYLDIENDKIYKKVFKLNHSVPEHIEEIAGIHLEE